jgi:hypothetical protein
VKALITEVQVYDEVHDLVCTLKAFDEESFTITWKDEIHLADELRFVADLIESKALYAEIKDSE